MPSSIPMVRSCDFTKRTTPAIVPWRVSLSSPVDRRSRACSMVSVYFLAESVNRELLCFEVEFNFTQLALPWAFISVQRWNSVPQVLVFARRLHLICVATRQLQRTRCWHGDQLLFTSGLGDQESERSQVFARGPASLELGGSSTDFLSSTAQDPSTLEFGDSGFRPAVVSFTAPPACEVYATLSREPLISERLTCTSL